LQTSQRNAASRGSKAGRDVACQSVESGSSNVESMSDWERVRAVAESWEEIDSEGASRFLDAIDVPRSRDERTDRAALGALSAFRGVAAEKLSFDRFDIVNLESFLCFF